MTTKAAQKISLWEFFQQLGENLYAARGASLFLRDYAGDRQLVKQS